jgi:hypothetical protein
MRYLVILFLLLCEFTFGQIPGYSKFVGTRNFPTVYTLSCTLEGDFSTVTAQVINTGSLNAETGSPTPILVSGILWGNTPPSINDGVSNKTTDGNINGQPFTSIATPLPDEYTIYIVAYATTAAGTFYGKVLTLSQDVVRSPFTNKIWMDRNVGATALPVTPQTGGDDPSYGGLYQWGRKSDGHEVVLPRTLVSGTTYTFFSGTESVSTTTTSAVVSNKFFTSGDGNANWLIGTNIKTSLWQGLTGENNPCPAGYRVPTLSEFTNETTNFNTQDRSGAFSSFLRLPVTGSRGNTGTPSSYNGYTIGRYWTSSISNNVSSAIVFSNIANSLTTTTFGRVHGLAVRCIKGEASSGGSAVISGYTEGSSSGYLKIGEPVSNVTKTIFANVGTAGTYSISTLPINNNGVVYSAKGTLAAGNNQSITLTAQGTPTSQDAYGTWYYFLNTDRNFGFYQTILAEPSTNGNAIVSEYTSISSSGNMLQSMEVSNTTQTIRANVTKIGSYFLKTTTNSGITFSANGTFTSLGNNDITLVATGTPISAGNYTFTLNTSSPSFAFNRIVGNQSSGGSAMITWQGVSQSGLTTEQRTENSRAVVRLTEASTYSPPFIHYVAVNVTQIGTYNIDAPGNRNFEGNTLRLVGSGTFTTTGVQTIPLYVYGAAISYTGNPSVPHYFYLPRENYSPSYYVIRNSQ